MSNSDKGPKTKMMDEDEIEKYYEFGTWDQP